MPTLDDLSFLFTDSFTSLTILIPVIGALATIFDWLKNHTKVVRLSDPTHLALIANLIGVVCIFNNLYLLAYLAYLINFGTILFRISKQRTTYNGHSDLVRFQNNLASCLNPTLMLFVTMNLHGLHASSQQFMTFYNQNDLIYSSINNLYLGQKDIVDRMSENVDTISSLVKSIEQLTTQDEQQVNLIGNMVKIEQSLVDNVDSIRANQAELLSIQMNQVATMERLSSSGANLKSGQN
ncbi:hypothetical protein QR676_09010 [Vibrio sp. TMPB1044]|uniref:hypothetical protein n=1 Tax=Vibrio sp. TMPB1044 TaxID=3051822 RepID=UPI00255B8FA0|nr:hypothetical protein [Vibrio sp. TMPB1044]MDL5027365.1 hypothetical protein [Vibrio sp. TMPB1044]MDN5207493.1 hypothetical protein [Vibrio sp. TMPB1044]